MIKEMAGKGRFKVPTSSQMDDKESDVKSMSLFSNFKKKQSATSTDQGNPVKQPTLTRSGGIATPQINQDIAVKPSSTNSSLSSLVAPLSSASGATKAPITGHAVKGSTSTLSASCSAAAVVEKSSSSTATSSDARATGSAVNNETGPAPATKAASTNSIVVNYRQRGNPILKHIRNIPWEYGSIVPDYVLGKANCALFLSLRYHQLNPTYLHNRLKELGKGYDLRVLLVQVDVKDPHHLLKDLAKICILADCTLMLAFTPEEAGRYLEAYKVYENKPAEALMEKTDTDYISKLTDCLTTVKSVNKTDSMTLLSEYKSMEGIVHASVEDLSFCAGFGPQKAKRLYDVFHQPFMKGRKRQSVNSADDGTSASPAKKS